MDEYDAPRHRSATCDVKRAFVRLSFEGKKGTVPVAFGRFNSKSAHVRYVGGGD